MARDNKRKEEELFVTVPNLFRCPISMDVMKSPVSLCTGVTYDRSSIEKWLALGHKTCPATMQTLPSTNTTPNLTLRRLIHLWLTHGDAASSSSWIITKQKAAEIIKSGAFDSDSISKLINFMTASEENLKFISLSNDAVSRLIDVFSADFKSEIRIREAIVEILDLISSEKGMPDRLNQLIFRNGGEQNCLSSFVTILQKGNTESKIKSAKLLSQIAINPESKREVSEKTGLLHELYLLSCDESNASAVEAGLSSLVAVTNTRPAKKELIRFGIVTTVRKILSGFNYSSPVGKIIEKALAILETVATCTEGRGAIVEDGECVVEVVKRLMKCSGVATEHGVAVIWSVCCLARDRTAQDEVRKVNGLTKVLLVMQSNISESTRQMCNELVKVLRAKNAKSKLAPYETKTTHITPY